jgi:hypothetical protein
MENNRLKVGHFIAPKVVFDGFLKSGIMAMDIIKILGPWQVGV